MRLLTWREQQHQQLRLVASSHPTIQLRLSVLDLGCVQMHDRKDPSTNQAAKTVATMRLFSCITESDNSCFLKCHRAGEALTQSKGIDGSLGSNAAASRGHF